MIRMPDRSSIIVRVPILIALAVPSFTSPAQAQSASEVQAMVEALTGKWVEDVSKRQLGSAPPLRFQKNAKGELEEELGPPGHTFTYPVIFDGKPRAAGPGKASGAWKQTAPRHFESQLWEAGQSMGTRKLEISEDGKTISEISETFLPDGKTDTSRPVYRRETGTGTSLEGLWKMVSDGSPAEIITIQPVGPDSIRIAGSSGDASTNTLDGKPAIVTAPMVMDGGTRALRIKDARTLEDVLALKGADFAKGTMQLSPDGKTLRRSMTVLGVKADPSATVYVKQ